MTAGVNSTGFTKKTIEDIKADVEDYQLANVDPEINTAADQPLGQLNAIVSRTAAELWELGELIYHFLDPDAAEGRLQDNICKITGVTREHARKSAVVQTCNLTIGFSALAGQMMVNSVGSDTVKWTNVADVPAVGSTDDYLIDFESVDYGPVAANAGTLTVITNPMTGWNSTTNAADAIEGALDESDTVLRQRRVDELTAPGASTADAIRTDLLEVEGVQQAFVFENTSLITDGNGVPGKAFEAVIYDGAGASASNNAVAQAIWDSKPSGAETHGTIAATAIDKQGTERTVYFSRATIENVYLEIDLITDTTFPAAGRTLVKNALVARGNTWNLGDDVIALALKAAALTVQGVVDVTALRLDFSASPVNTSNLVVTGRQIARFDTGRVLVNGS